ncbi:MAG TPA: hypothetical protein HA232_03590 [Methanocellales archaeon]|nr:hypothetical protein [Methanocellales archaeon]
MPFRMNRGFIPGYNLVEIINSTLGKLKGYDVLYLHFRNEYGAESTFVVFLNDLHLINQLMSLNYESFTYDEDIDEKDFIGLVLYAYLEPKGTYMKITKFKENV